MKWVVEGGEVCMCLDKKEKKERRDVFMWRGYGGGVVVVVVIGWVWFKGVRREEMIKV